MEMPDMMIRTDDEGLDDFDLHFDAGFFAALGGQEIVTERTRKGWRIEVFGAPEAVEYVAELLCVDVEVAA